MLAKMKDIESQISNYDQWQTTYTPLSKTLNFDMSLMMTKNSNNSTTVVESMVVPLEKVARLTDLNESNFKKFKNFLTALRSETNMEIIINHIELDIVKILQPRFAGQQIPDSDNCRKWEPAIFFSDCKK